MNESLARLVEELASEVATRAEAICTRGWRNRAGALIVRSGICLWGKLRRCSGVSRNVSMTSYRREG